MTQIGVWYSWSGKDSLDEVVSAEFGGRLAGAIGGVAGAAPGLAGVGGALTGAKRGGGKGGGGGGGGGRSGRRGGRGGGGGDAGGGDAGGGKKAKEAPHVTRARTPYHSTHTYPDSAGRGRTPYHDTHKGIHPGSYPVGDKGEHVKRARTPFHDTHPYLAKKTPSRAATPFHSTHKGIHPGSHPAEATTTHKADTPFHDKHPYFQSKPGETTGSATLRDQRADARKQVGKGGSNPQLRQKILNIGAGENQGPEFYESMLNRTQVQKIPLEQAARYTSEKKGYYDDKKGTYRKTGSEAKEGKWLDQALAGSNVSNYASGAASGGASGHWVDDRIAKGVYPGGKRFKSHGETYVGEGAGWKNWYDRTRAAEAGGGGTTHGARTRIDTSIPDYSSGAGGGMGRPGRFGGGGGGGGGGSGYTGYSGPAHDPKFAVKGSAASAGANPTLINAGREASRHLPEGWRAEALSGHRPGSHGEHGKGPHGNAVDFQLYNEKGQKVPWYQSAPNFRAYEQFHQNLHRALPPSEQGRHRWGGYFGDVGGRHVYGSMDLMHSDLGGPGRMAAGSWRSGLTPEYRKHWGARSEGMGSE